MKRFLLPIGALAMILASCDTSMSDSYSTMNFSECNLISDLQNADQPAQISSSVYSLTINWNKYCVNLSTSDLVINNQKVSFETDTMKLSTYYLYSEVNGSNVYVDNNIFGSSENVGLSSTVTDLSALFTPGVYSVSNLYVPGVDNSSYSYLNYRLIMGYDLNSRYHVQTFWSDSYYLGTSYVSGNETFSTGSTAYRVILNAENNTAKVVVYYPQLSSADVDLPKAIVLEDVPIMFSNKYYYLESDAPKTQVLGSENGVTALVDTDTYNVTNFLLTMGDEDLTQAVISYKIDGKFVTFDGCSIVKASN